VDVVRDDARRIGVENELFTAALGLHPPWEVVEIRFEPGSGRIDFQVAFTKGARFACPACGAADQPVHDTRERTWRHLSFFEFAAYIHAKVPRVECGECGKTSQVAVPWARPESGFTVLMEALVVTLCREMPVRKVAQLFGVSDGAIWRVLDHHVGLARSKENFCAVRRVGMDETACRRGHHYVSLFHDLDGARLLFGCEGRDKQTVEAFADDLKAHQGDPKAVVEACMDMSAAYIAGTQKYLPNADITFDPFHVIQLINSAVDEVRRAEVKDQPCLKGTRYLWLKDRGKWTRTQRDLHETLPQRGLKTARAWRIKESLREIYAARVNHPDATRLLRKWYGWAIRSRLEPVKRVARTIKAHWDGVLRVFETGATTALLEGVNSLIQAAKARARGYGTTRHLIAIAYLIAGKLRHLPKSPYALRTGQNRER
jgi:transposase